MGCGASTQGPPSAGDGKNPVYTSNDGAVKPSKGDGAAASLDSDSFNDGTSKDDKKARRKTQTPRRVAVSTETSDSAGAPASEGELTLVPKSDEVAAQLMRALKAHPLFEHLAGALLTLVVQAMEERVCADGEQIITEGDAGDHFYLVFGGSFEAYTKRTNVEGGRYAVSSSPRGVNGASGGADDGDEDAPPQQASPFPVNAAGETILQTFGVDDGFGELALLYNSPRACSVRATSAAATVYALDRLAFRKLVMQHNSGVKHGLEKHLSTVPLLADLDSAERSRLADIIETEEYADGEYIVQIGEAADCLYLILSGEVVCHHEAGGKELSRLRQGDVFGESSINDDEADPHRLANVVAVGDVRVGKLRAADFKAVMGSLTMAMNVALNRKVLESVEILQDLNAVELEGVLRELKETSYEAGTSIITQGETGTNFYILKSGTVDVLQDTGDGAKVINTLGPGGHFGERALLTAEPTIATILSSSAVQVMTLDKEAFERVLPPLQDLISRGVAEREEQAARAARPTIQQKDLRTITVLGEGTFGRVRLVQWREKAKGERVPFALKCLQKGQLVYYKQVDHVVNEKRVLAMCFHPFILKLEATFASKNQIYMLLEVALGGELFTHLRNEIKFEPSTAVLYAAMVTSAFAYLHARKIAHRDLKPENLLFDKQGYLKLVDFGFAKVIKDRTWTLCGTPEYLAPEIISNRGHNIGADWWTLGILTYEMLVGQPPFVGQSQLETYHKITRGKYKMPTTFTPQIKDFISRLLMHNPAVRLGCSWTGSTEVTSHDFFAGLSFKDLEMRRLPMPHVPVIKDAFDASNFDQYSDDDGAAQWTQFNAVQYDDVWRKEFGDW